MPIRVLLVEDSPVALVILKRILEASPTITVVGTARTGLDALALIPETQPDVICTDFHMPQMDGLEFTVEVMARFPRPILVISASVQEEDSHHIFQLLEAGAVDICPKPLAGMLEGNHTFNRSLIEKIQVLSGVKVFKKRRPAAVLSDLSNRTGPLRRSQYVKPKVIVVGASTGGPQALQTLFTPLPANFPVPILCVQHICLGFLKGFIEWLNIGCQLPIQIAEPGSMPKPGHIYFPPEQQHLGLDAQGRFICVDLPPLDGHRPSVTVMFNSVARVHGRRTVGVLLTGMGRDGADGIQSIANAGGLTIAQDEATSIVFGMPKEAIQLGAVSQVLPIQAIAPALLDLVSNTLPSGAAS